MTIKLPARRNFLKYGMAAALGAAAFPLSGAGPAFSHTFPAHSLTVLTLHSQLACEALASTGYDFVAASFSWAPLTLPLQRRTLVRHRWRANLGQWFEDCG